MTGRAPGIGDDLIVERKPGAQNATVHDGFRAVHFKFKERPLEPPTGKEEFESRHRSLELEKLSLEVAGLRTERHRSWLTTLTLVGAIVVSLTTAYQYMETIKSREREYELEARLRTTAMLQDKILWQIAARSDTKLTRTEQVAAFHSGLALAQAYPNVRPAIEAALENLANAGDQEARAVLEKLKD